MKANIKKQSVKENKIVLSIGMIVKNEEKHLDNCLCALQKLRDNVSSELIIVDTGSTDRTREIALKYTDKVYDFEWINDFSAARNFGIEKAVGEWFMFIDADEYLDENCDEMINFFNTPEIKNQYNSASFIIKNHTGLKNGKSSCFMAPRLTRLTNDVRFHDAIHEWLPQPEPHTFFNTVFNHYGYAYKSKAEKEHKNMRNIEPMIKEYEELKKHKNPYETLRILNHICDLISDDYFKTSEIKEKYLDEYLNISKKHIEEYGENANFYAVVSYFSYARYYSANKNRKKNIEILNEFISSGIAKESILYLMAYLYLSRSYMSLAKSSDAYNSIEKYFEFYNKYKNGELNLEPMNYSTINGLSDFEYEEMILYASRCLYNLERYDEAWDYLNKFNISDSGSELFSYFLNLLKDLIGKTHNYSYAFSCYKKIIEINDRDKADLMLFLLEQYYMTHSAERKDFIDQAVKYGQNERYFELAHLIKDDMDGKDISEGLADFLRSAECWKNGYSEAIYLAMKHKADIIPALERMGNNIIKNIIKTISDGHEAEYAEVALDYCLDFDYSAGIKQMLWCVSALEAAVIKSNELSSEKLPVLFDFFVSILSDYVGNIYNPELMNPEDIDVLPELHRFGYFIAAAFGAKNEGDIVNYVRNMKEALRVCEPMKNVVSFYLNELEKEMKR